MRTANNSITVLLVEDLEDDRYIFQHTLKSTRPDAKLVTASDGFEAIDYLQNKGRPDVMFLDLKMPGCNGFEVLRWMRERSLVTKVKVYVLSGSSEERDMTMTKELGAQAYLVKPITSERLQPLLVTEGFMTDCR